MIFLEYGNFLILEHVEFLCFWSWQIYFMNHGKFTLWAMAILLVAPWQIYFFRIVANLFQKHGKL